MARSEREKQSFQVTMDGGLDESLPPSLIQPNKMSELTNVQVTRGGSYEQRPGFRNLATASHLGLTTNIKEVYEHDKQLLGYDGEMLNVYSELFNTWLPVDRASEAQILSVEPGNRAMFSAKETTMGSVADDLQDEWAAFVNISQPVIFDSVTACSSNGETPVKVRVDAWAKRDADNVVDAWWTMTDVHNGMTTTPFKITPIQAASSQTVQNEVTGIRVLTINTNGTTYFYIFVSYSVITITGGGSATQAWIQCTRFNIANMVLQTAEVRTVSFAKALNRFNPVWDATTVGAEIVVAFNELFDTGSSVSTNAMLLKYNYLMQLQDTSFFYDETAGIGTNPTIMLSRVALAGTDPDGAVNKLYVTWDQDIVISEAFGSNSRLRCGIWDYDTLTLRHVENVDRSTSELKPSTESVLERLGIAVYGSIADVVYSLRAHVINQISGNLGPEPYFIETQPVLRVQRITSSGYVDIQKQHETFNVSLIGQPFFRESESEREKSLQYGWLLENWTAYGQYNNLVLTGLSSSIDTVYFVCGDGPGEFIGVFSSPTLTLESTLATGEILAAPGNIVLTAANGSGVNGLITQNVATPVVDITLRAVKQLTETNTLVSAPALYVPAALAYKPWQQNPYWIDPTLNDVVRPTGRFQSHSYLLRCPTNTALGTPTRDGDVVYDTDQAHVVMKFSPYLTGDAYGPLNSAQKRLLDDMGPSYAIQQSTMHMLPSCVVVDDDSEKHIETYALGVPKRADGSIDIDVGYDVYEFGFKVPGSVRPARYGKTTLFSGGQPMQWDGKRLVEVGWNYYPRIDNIARGYYDPGPFPNPYVEPGVYSYKAVYVWMDKAGQIHTSTPSEPWTVVHRDEPDNVLVDGDMEDSSMDAWIPNNDALAMKTGSFQEPLRADSAMLDDYRVMQIQANNGSRSAYVESIFQAEEGVSYILSGATRAAGSALPYITDGEGNLLWMTSSTPSTWKTFQATIIPSGSTFRLGGTNFAVSSSWVQYDNISLTPTRVGSNYATITVDSMTLTRRDVLMNPFEDENTSEPVMIELYRTLKGPGTEYYLVKRVPSNVRTATTSIEDAFPDKIIQTNRRIYTAGGLYPTGCPGAFKQVAVHDGRPFAINAEDSTQVVFGHFAMPGEAARFPDGWSLRSSDGNNYTAIGSLGDKLVGFQNHAIDAFFGNGPNEAGQGLSYSDPQRVSQVHGCVDNRSLVRYPNGFVFKSDDGVWAMDESFSPQYVGRTIQNQVDNYPDVTAAVLDDANHRILISLADWAGCRSVVASWDWAWNVWSTWTFDALPAVVSPSNPYVAPVSGSTLPVYSNASTGVINSLTMNTRALKRTATAATKLDREIAMAIYPIRSYDSNNLSQVIVSNDKLTTSDPDGFIPQVRFSTAWLSTSGLQTRSYNWQAALLMSSSLKLFATEIDTFYNYDDHPLALVTTGSWSQSDILSGSSHAAVQLVHQLGRPEAQSIKITTTLTPSVTGSTPRDIRIEALTIETAQDTGLPLLNAEFQKR